MWDNEVYGQTAAFPRQNNKLFGGIKRCWMNSWFIGPTASNIEPICSDITQTLVIQIEEEEDIKN